MLDFGASGQAANGARYIMYPAVAKRKHGSSEPRPSGTALSISSSVLFRSEVRLCWPSELSMAILPPPTSTRAGLSWPCAAEMAFRDAACEELLPGRTDLHQYRYSFLCWFNRTVLLTYMVPA